MATQFPDNLDNFTNPANGDKLDSPSHSGQHSDANDAITEIETKLGIGASAAGSAVAGYSLIHEAGGTTSWGPIVSIDGGSTILSTDADIEPLILQGGTPEIATVGSVSANGTTITYTASNAFTAGQAVRITGVNPAQFNFDRAVLATAGTGDFTVTNAGTGTYVSGGTAILYQGNLQEWKDYEGNVVASVNQFGKSSFGGLVHIETQSFSAVSAVNFSNNVFTSEFANYKFIFNAVHSESSNTRIRFRTNGTDNSNSNYNTQLLSGSASTTAASAGTAGQQFGLNDSSLKSNAEILIFDPQLAVNTRALATTLNGTLAVRLMGCEFTATTVFDSLSLLVSTGTISGTMSVYGLKD
jgi:hypothetical protein